MRKTTCPSCTLKVTEADKEWDEIIQTGYCTKCNLKTERVSAAETVISGEINKVEKMLNKKGSKFIAALVVIAFFLGSLLLLNTSFNYGKLLYKASISSKSWGLVKGNILSAAVKKECDASKLNRFSQKIYSININYTYQIEGNKYENNQIGFGSQQCYLKADAESELQKYPINSNILVYYNPASKSESVLMRAMSGESEIIICIISFILALYGLRSLFYFIKIMVMQKTIGVRVKLIWV